MLSGMSDTPAPTMAVDGLAIAAFLLYLALIVLIGLAAMRFSSAGVSEFFVGGRRMNRFVVALSAVVSGRSAWLLLGVTGLAYATGASAIWAVTGYTVAELLLFLFFAPRLRRFSEAYGCVTLPDVFAARFEDGDGRLRLAVVAVILVFMVSYVAAQFVGGGKAFAAGFGLAPATGVALTAGIVLVYTLLGGFLAVSLTDAVQAGLMLVALVVLPVVAVVDFGGWHMVAGALTAQSPTLVDPLALSGGALLGFLGIGLGSPGSPHIVVRYMSIADPAQLRVSALVGTVWNVVMGWGAVAIGLAGRAYFPEVTALPGADTEQLFPTLAREHLHPFVFGAVVAAVFAAIMSTADSQLLVAASAVVRDVYQQVVARGREVSERLLVAYSRTAVVVLVLLALALGIVASELVFWLVLFAWAGPGAALGPPLLVAFAWRGATRAGMLAGILAGTLTTVVWYLTPALKGAMYELVPGFAAGLAATIVVSLLTRRPATTDAMFEAMEGHRRRGPGI